jgi:hypothetical protein
MPLTTTLLHRSPGPWLAFCLGLLALILAIPGQLTAAPTTITGTITGPNGAYPSCRLIITPGFAFTTPDSTFVAQTPPTIVQVSAIDGTFSVNLQPNDTSSPANSYYIVRFSCTNQEVLWRVPTSGTSLNFSAVQTSSMPRPPLAIALSQLAPGGATNGQVVKFNGTSWVPGTDGGGGGASLPVTSSLLKGDGLGGAAAATAADIPGLVGDGGFGGVKGAAPAPAAGDTAAGKFLRADATWAMTHPLTTRGDLFVQLSGGIGRLPLGTSGYVLTSNGTDAVWAVAPSGFADPMTTRGDIIYRGPSGTGRLAVGTNGHCLKSNGTDPVWGVCSTFVNPMTSAGEMIYGGSGGTPSVVISNTTTTRKFLRTASIGGGIPGTPAWDTLAAGDLPNPGIGSKGGVEAKTCSGNDKVSAIGIDGVPVCSAIAATAPYTTTVTAQTSVSITAATHLQGTTAVGFCFDDSTPRQIVGCTYTRAANGDFVFSFTPAFTGLLQVGGAGGGGGGGGDGLGTAAAGDIVALFTGCSGIEYLGADGACHADATGGTYTEGPSGGIDITGTVVDLDTAIVCRKADNCVHTGVMDLSTASGIKIKEGTPASASATCVKGTILYDASYTYTCVATDTWRRAAHATW